MTQEQTFTHPPRGHVAHLAYDAGNDRFQVVHVDADGNLQVEVAQITAVDGHLYAWDGSAWQKLLVESDTDPNLRVGIYDGDIQARVLAPSGDNRSANYPSLLVIGQLYGFDGTYWDRLRCTDQKLDTVLYGWDGSQARKLPLVWGYGGTVVQYLYDETLDAGAQLLQGNVVPAGEVWTITSVGVLYIGTQSVTVDARAYVSATPAILKSYVAPGTGRWYADVVQAVLAPGDYMAFYISGNLVNEDLHATYIGYKMRIDQ